ncbi:MAG: HEAT repeat domain-containing protein [Bacteroidota bacterium]
MLRILFIWPRFNFNWFTTSETAPVRDATYEAVIQFCIVFIVCCLTGAMLFGLYLFYVRLRNEALGKRISKLEERYGLLLTGIIFEEGDDQFEEKKKKLIRHFKKTYLKSNFNKRILRKELLKLHKSFSGSSQKVLHDLYRELGLHKAALSDLNKTDWSIRADAAKELSQMQYTEVKFKMLKLSAHENPVLRLEAQAAYLALEKDNPFRFLETAKTEITEWQQLNLEEIAKRMESDKIPLFANWFGLRNQSVVEFCVKMTATFNQFESGEELIKLLTSKDARVVKESVKALGNLFVMEAQEPLMQLYPDSAPEIQNEIIMSLGKLGGEGVLIFLTEILYNGLHEQSLRAALAIRSTGYEGDSILQEALQGEQKHAAAVAAHMLDERI